MWKLCEICTCCCCIPSHATFFLSMSAALIYACCFLLGTSKRQQMQCTAISSFGWTTKHACWESKQLILSNNDKMLLKLILTQGEQEPTAHSRRKARVRQSKQILLKRRFAFFPFWHDFFISLNSIKVSWKIEMLDFCQSYFIHRAERWLKQGWPSCFVALMRHKSTTNICTWYKCFTWRASGFSNFEIVP